MKTTFIRGLCGFLILMMAIGIMAGVIFAMSNDDEIATWTKVSFYTTAGKELCLYNAEGDLIDCLQTDHRGACTTSMLEEGKYYGVCRDGLVEFELTSLGLENVRGPVRETADFAISFVVQQPLGKVRIHGKAKQEWYEYELQASGYSCKKVLRCTEGERINYTMENIPYGNYTLLENGRILCHLTLSAEEPLIDLSLP